MRLQRVLAVVAASCMVSIGLCTPSMAQTAYNPERVVEQLQHKSSGLKIIVSHRGIYGPGCAENSVCSIRAAAAQNIEAVEVDIKESRNGTLWLFHENTVGRSTDFGAPNLFDPFSPNVGRNGASNFLVSTLSDSTLNALHVRDINGKVLPEYPIRLQDLFSLAKYDFPNTAFILDLKTASSVSTAAFLARQAGVQDRVVLKFSVAAIGPQAVESYTNGQPFAPTLYTGDENLIVAAYIKAHPNEHLHTYADVLQSYLDRYVYVPGFKYFELGMKTWPNGSIGGYAFHLHNLNVAIGNFSPVPEARGGYFRSDGTCCASLNDYLTKSPYFGDEPRDDRTNLSGMIDFFDTVLTDSAPQAEKIATDKGFRRYIGLIE